MITSSQFKELFPKCQDVDGWVAALNDVLPKYEINTKTRIAAFLAQCGHESGGWTVFTENLNYSADGLKKIFSKYFTTGADQYARQPEKIANKVYASRMGNGPESSGDGWKYRGRGPIQITGKTNYADMSKFLFKDDRLVTTPDLVTTDKNVCILSAVWYWTTRNLNVLADEHDMITMTKKINGGTIGLDDRIARYQEAMRVL